MKKVGLFMMLGTNNLKPSSMTYHVPSSTNNSESVQVFLNHDSCGHEGAQGATMLYDHRLRLLALQTPAQYHSLLQRAAQRLDLAMPMEHNNNHPTGIDPMSQLAIPPLAQLYVRAFEGHYPADIRERVRYYALHAQAESSLVGLETWWRLASACCTTWGVSALPMSAWTAIAIITIMADAGYALGSVRWMVRTLANAHRYADLPDPTRDARFLLVLRGITRELGTQPRNRKAALRLAKLRGMVSIAYSRATPRALYELAVLLTLWFGAFRSEELVAIDIEQAEWPESQDGQIAIYVPKSKTDQVGRGEVVYLDALPEDPQLCPVRLLTLWRGVLGRETGALFPSLTRTGKIFGDRMCTRTVTRVVKKYAGLVGLEPKDYASHSGRAGFITEAIIQKIPDAMVMEHTRHLDLRSLRPYFRPGDDRPNLSRAVACGRAPALSPSGRVATPRTI